MIGWIIRIALWALAGFVATKIMGGKLSLLWNIVLGLAGGALGSLVAKLFGIATTNKIGFTLISIIGACLVIWLARLILPRLKR